MTLSFVEDLPMAVEHYGREIIEGKAITEDKEKENGFLKRIPWVRLIQIWFVGF